VATKPTYRHPYARARYSNDLLVLPGCDGRSARARRYRDIVRGLLEDLGVTEADLTATQRVQVRRAATLAVDIEQGEGTLPRDEPIRMEGHLERKLWALGLSRRKRPDLGPDLTRYLREVKGKPGIHR
jgi:hypothetical protein